MEADNPSAKSPKESLGVEGPLPLIPASCEFFNWPIPEVRPMELRYMFLMVTEARLDLSLSLSRSLASTFWAMEAGVCSCEATLQECWRKDEWIISIYIYTGKEE